jgi:hypothetical protein
MAGSHPFVPLSLTPASWLLDAECRGLAHEKGPRTEITYQKTIRENANII